MHGDEIGSPQWNDLLFWPLLIDNSPAIFLGYKLVKRKFHPFIILWDTSKIHCWKNPSLPVFLWPFVEMPTHISALLLVRELSEIAMAFMYMLCWKRLVVSAFSSSMEVTQITVCAREQWDYFVQEMLFGITVKVMQALIIQLWLSVRIVFLDSKLILQHVVIYFPPDFLKVLCSESRYDLWNIKHSHGLK